MPPSDVLVVERGADWTDWMHGRSCRDQPVISLIQAREEAPWTFAARVRSRVDRLLAENVSIGSVTVLGADDWEIPTLQARLELLRLAHEGCPSRNIHVELHLQAPESGCTIDATPAPEPNRRSVPCGTPGIAASRRGPEPEARVEL